jgi:hypothetical protein
MKPGRPGKLKNPRPTQTKVEGYYGGATESSERVKESVGELTCRRIHRISVLAYAAHQQAPYVSSGSGRASAH